MLQKGIVLCLSILALVSILNKIIKLFQKIAYTLISFFAYITFVLTRLLGPTRLLEPTRLLGPSRLLGPTQLSDFRLFLLNSI